MRREVREKLWAHGTMGRWGDWPVGRSGPGRRATGYDAIAIGMRNDNIMAKRVQEIGEVRGMGIGAVIQSTWGHQRTDAHIH